MTDENVPGTGRKIICILVYLLAILPLGGSIGSLMAHQDGKMGFDALASFLGGAMWGAVIGLVVGIWIAFRHNLVVVKRATWAGLGLLVAQILFHSLRMLLSE